MTEKQILQKIILVIVFIPSILYGAPKDKLKLVTYPRTFYEYPGGGAFNTQAEQIIKTLHERLEEAIKINAQGKIKFSLRNKREEILEDICDSLKDSYYNLREEKRIIKEFNKFFSDSLDAILFVNFEKSSKNIALYEIQAKFVNSNENIQVLSKAEIEIGKDDLVERLLNYKLNILAKNLINKIKEYRNFDTHQFLNFSTLSSFATFTSSIVWYGIENCNVHDSYGEYKKTNSYEDATKFRIKTEKSLSRRNVARNIALISGTSLVFFLLRDCLWHPSIKNAPRNNRAENKKLENIKPAIYCSIQNENLLISMQLNF
jgi:hypothetical protein